MGCHACAEPQDQYEEGSSHGRCGLRRARPRRIRLLRARSPCPADRTREMTGAGILTVALVAIAAALVVYLLIALIDPERF
ncbi:hypothetical protein OPAG_05774 [Rhodococcus opacus PD630]|nr:hypothetical protein OPAG_05774 [Rhodococcus opacus PD630]